jgi:phenylpropionate dioxygenase-like ring-hydroxylating dioxygenase large terminal subunit
MTEYPGSNNEAIPAEPVADNWYVVAPSKKLKHKPLRLELHNQRLVLWRAADGQIVAHIRNSTH